MRKLLFLCVTFIFYFTSEFSAHASQAILSASDEKSERLNVVKVGMPTTFELLIWPIEDISMHTIRGWKEKGFLDSIVITKIISAGKSKSDSTVFELRFIGLAKSPKEFNEDFFDIIDIEDFNVPLTPKFSAIVSTVVVDEIKGKDFHFIPRSILKPESHLLRDVLLGFVALFIIVLIFVFLKKFEKKQRLREEAMEENERFLDLVASLETRTGLEKIVANQDFLFKRLNGREGLFKDICREVEAIQYKETWSEEQEQSLAKKMKKCLQGATDGV